MTYEATDADLDAIAAEKVTQPEPVETTAELLRRLTKERNEARAEVEHMKDRWFEAGLREDHWRDKADALAAKLARVEALAEHIYSAPAETWGVPIHTPPAEQSAGYLAGVEDAILFAHTALHAALADADATAAERPTPATTEAHGCGCICVSCEALRAQTAGPNSSVGGAL